MVGQAAHFPSGARLEYASATNIDSQEGTLEFWYKPNWSPGAASGYIFCSWGFGGGMVFQVDGGPNLRGIFNRWSSEIQVITSASSWTAGSWHHIAYTWSSSARLLRLYLDGSLANEWHLSTPLPTITDPRLMIGSEDGGAAVDGLLDELSISTRAKTSREVVEAYLGARGMTGLRFDPNTLTLWPTWRRRPTLVAETPTGDVPLPADSADLSTTNATVAGVRPDGYIVAAAGGSCQIGAVLLGHSATLNLTVQTPVRPPTEETIAPELAAPATGYLYEMPVVIVRFLPTLDGVNVDPSKIGEDWVTVQWARDQIALYERRVKYGLEERSRFRGYQNPAAAPALGYRVLKIITFYEPMPPYMEFDDGSGWHQPDYGQIIERVGSESWVRDHNVKEFWVWGYHYDGIYPVESDMSSPTTGDVSNSFRLGDLPVYDRTYTVYGYNFMRTQSEALHNHGHQIEAILSHVANLQDGNGDLFWRSFCGMEAYWVMGTGRAGTCHCPPNTTLDYDYLNSTPVWSDCEDWTPGHTGSQKLVNADTWRALPYTWPGGPIPDQQMDSNYYLYWWQNMPGWDNTIPYGATEVMTNWWKFTGDWDGSIARMATEGGLHGPSAPRLTLLEMPDQGPEYDWKVWALFARLARQSDLVGIPGKSLTFAIDGTIVGSATTASSGYAWLEMVWGMEVGHYALTCTFDGDAESFGASGGATLTVNKGWPALVCSDRTQIIGQTVNLEAWLRSRYDDSGLDGLTVTFSVDGSQLGSAVTGTTGAPGRADLPWVVTPGQAQREILAVFAGDAHFKSASGSATLTTSRTATRAYTVDRSCTGADAVLLRGYLYRKSDTSGLGGKSLTYQIDGVDVGAAVTAPDGSSSLSWVIGPGPTSRLIGVSFAGDDTYAESTASARLTVATYDTTLTVPSRSCEIGDSVYLRAYLSRADTLQPVVGKSIVFRIGGSSVATGATNTLGRAMPLFTVPDTMDPGSYAYQADWAGDAGYRLSSGSATFIVDKGVSYLWMASRSMARGSSAYLRGYLRRLPDYAWLSGKSVQYRLDGLALGSAVTDSNGAAALLYAAPSGMATGSHTVLGTFAGDARYLGDGGVATLTVTN
jgi:hypothetical protein